MVFELREAVPTAKACPACIWHPRSKPRSRNLAAYRTYDSAASAPALAESMPAFA